MADVDGGVMRVNSVETNSGFIDQYSPPSDGTSYTRVEVEACAISDNVDSGYIEWEAFLDDGSVAELSYTNSEAPMLTLIPGDCARGYVVYVVPNGAELTSISHTDFWTDERFVWDLTAAPVAIDGPMPASGGTGNEIGSSFTFNSGVEATVVDAGNYESTDEYYELPDGRRLVAANVRVCSESTTTVFASDFYVFTDDNFVATVEYYNSSFVTTDLNPGDCAEGGVVFLIPEDSNPSMIMYKEFGTSEFARWMP
jgi:hypothetical protein